MTPQKAEAFLKSLNMPGKKLAENFESWKKFLRYFPAGFSNDFKKFAAQTFAEYRNYLICYDRSDRQKAFCTYCGHTVVLPKVYAHNASTDCPVCHCRSDIKNNWRIKSVPSMSGYVMQYDKADYDKQAVVCRCVYVLRIVDPIELTVKWRYETRHYYLFKTGCCRHCEHTGPGMMYYIDYFTEHKSMFNPLKSQCYGPQGENLNSLAEAVKGTKWQYAMPLEMSQLGMTQGDGVRLLELYEKHPQIEYLIKAGFGDVVYKRLDGYATSDIVNWHAKNIKKALKINLSKPDFKYIRNLPEAPDCKTLRIYKLLKSEKPGKLLESWRLPDWLKDIWHFEYAELTEISGCIGSLEKAWQYIEKQHAQNIKNNALITKSYMVRDWRDYLRECAELGLDMHDTAIIMPKNLQQAHENTTLQIEARADELLNKKIAERVEKRKQFNFEHENLFCRPAASSDELVAEGTALCHCVGTYAKNYAEAKTHIVFIRRADAPEVPFYTMEVDTNYDVVQVRGLKNCGMTDEVKEFVKQFKSRVLRKLKRKGRKAA